ncbi:hypothetical protein C8Q73DRAFT_638018 [Cubamyces lactineus]|nr:hypothetical protein C8Q73DRAFT_638018 [Cubamyces lactineus]
MSDNKSSASNKTSDTYVPKSNNEYYKSFGGYNNFMRSYGLKPWDDDDVQEGKAIIEAFKEGDRQDWEEAQKN